jgi:hypothetical protein
MNATRVLCSCASGGIGGASWASRTGGREGKLERPPFTLIDGSGGRGVVGDGRGGGPPRELRWVPVDLRLGTGLPWAVNSSSISELLGVFSTAEYVSSLAGLMAAASRSSLNPEPGLVGLISGEMGSPPKSVEEPAKKDDESLRTDFGFGNRLARVKVVRRGANRVSLSDLRASRRTGEGGVNSTVDFEAQDRRMDGVEDTVRAGENGVRRRIQLGLEPKKMVGAYLLVMSCWPLTVNTRELWR